MSSPAALLLACTALAGLDPRAGPADELVPRSEAGRRVETTIEATADLELSSATVTTNGQEHPALEVPDVKIERRWHVVLDDVCAAVADGRATVLRRAFRELEGGEVSSEHGAGHEVARTSPLDGRSVVLTKQGAAWVAAWPPGKSGEARLLAGLTAPTDFTAFLPGRAIDVGDTWTVPAAAWQELVRPGGRLGLASEQDDPDDAQLERGADERWDAELEARYAGRREVDGRRLGAIAVTGRAWTEASQDLVDERSPIARELRIEADVEVELLWDLELGRLHSIEMRAEARRTLVDTRSFPTEAEGSEFVVVSKLGFEGEITLSVAVRS